jgi:predicted RNase H-like HicB family nuclease
MTVFYVAILERDRPGRVLAHIPDLPGTAASGATRAEALAQLLSNANEHVRRRVEYADEVPAARDIDDIPANEGMPELGRALIPVEMPGKSVKISMTIDEALLRHVDRAAAAEGTTRSGYLASAAAKALRADKIFPAEIVDRARQVLAEGGPMLVMPLGKAKT